MAFSDVIIRQCGSKDADSNNDLRILWRMLKMMKTGFIRYLFAIIFMSVALSVFDMITALLFKNIIFRIENYAQMNMFTPVFRRSTMKIPTFSNFLIRFKSHLYPKKLDFIGKFYALTGHFYIEIFFNMLYKNSTT